MKRSTFPALRCRMGEWIYYLTFFTFSDIDFWIKPTDQIHQSEQLREMIQRALSTNVGSIADYLLTQPERFFNSIVVGVYGGTPTWYPIEVTGGPVSGPELTPNDMLSIGVLQFDGIEELFAIDGQHRVEGIKEAIQRDSGLKTDELAVILLAHEKSEHGQQRTRRLFTTLNKWAKPVSKAEIIALDEDDAFAIVTRRLVEEFELLKSPNRHQTRFVHFGSQPSLNTGDETNLTTIRTVYEICSTIYMPILPNSPQSKRKAIIHDRRIRPKEQTIEEIYSENTRYWTLLVECIPAYRDLFNSEPQDKVAGHYRESGGHFMFRPLGQQTFARAVRILMDRGFSMERAVKDLATVPMKLDEVPWLNVLWNSHKQTIVRNFGAFYLEALLLYMVGQRPRKNMPLLNRYRAYVRDENASLPNPVKNTLL